MGKLRFDNKSILVIEDQAEMRSSLKSMLDRIGNNKINVAINGEEALEYLRSNEYDLVLSDYELGRGKDGQQVLEETRHAKLLRQGSAFVLVTAAQTIEMVMGALEYHPDGYIAKPVTFNALETRLQKIIKQKSYFKDITDAIDDGNVDKALGECDRLIMVHPKLALATLRIKGKLLFDDGRFSGAREVYRTVLDTRDVAWAVLGYSKCLHQAGENDEAIERLEKLTKTNDRYVECYDLLAKIYEAKSDIKKSQEILMAAVERSPKAILRQAYLAELALKNKDYDTASKASRRAVNLSKNSCHKKADNYLNLACSLQEQLAHGGHRDKTYALNEIQKSLVTVRKDYPMEQEVHIRAGILEGMTLKNQGKEEAAKNAVMIARKIFSTVMAPSDIKTVQCIVDGLVACTDTDTAQGFLKEVEEKAVLEFEELQELQEEVSKSLEAREEEISESYNNRAVALFEKGKIRDSIELFEKALKNNRGSYGVLLNAIQAIVMLMQKSGVDYNNKETCRKYLKRASSLTEDDPRYDRYKKLQKMFDKLVK
jgi:CheY-like chemotaxis protein